MPGILFPPGSFFFFLNLLSVQMVWPTNPAQVRNYNILLSRKKPLPLCCKEEISLFDFCRPKVKI